MFRDTILIRPPCEAWSVLIGITEGCSWGRCRFCGVYDGKQLVQAYRVRPWESIKADIDAARDYFGPRATTAFLAGGNALSAPTDLLARTLEYLRASFPGLQRVTSYAKNHDILKKSHEELVRLASTPPGLKIVYMGLESGSAAVLKYMNKGTTPAGMLRAARKVKAAGIGLSVYVILGLGGTKFKDHAIETARVLTSMDPDFIRFRSMNFIPNSSIYDEWTSGEFIPLRPVETLQEELTIVSNLGDGVGSVIINDHVSNFTDIQGKLPGDRDRIIACLKAAINHPGLKSLDHVNRTSM